MTSQLLQNARAQLIPLTTKEDGKVLRNIARLQIGLSTYSPSKWHTDEEFDQYLDTAIRERLPFIIYDNLYKSYVGCTSFANISLKDKRVEIGWTWISKEVQRTGLNQNIKWLMLSYAFEECEMMRVEFKADARNMASVNAMEGIGAIYEGKLRSHAIMSDGFRRNTVYYSILRDEWPMVSDRLLEKINQ